MKPETSGIEDLLLVKLIFYPDWIIILSVLLGPIAYLSTSCLNSNSVTLLNVEKYFQLLQL